MSDKFSFGKNEGLAGKLRTPEDVAQSNRNAEEVRQQQIHADKERIRRKLSEQTGVNAPGLKEGWAAPAGAPRRGEDTAGTMEETFSFKIPQTRKDKEMDAFSNQSDEAIRGTVDRYLRAANISIDDAEVDVDRQNRTIRVIGKNGVQITNEVKRKIGQLGQLR